MWRRREIFSSIGRKYSTGRCWSFTEILPPLAVCRCRSTCASFTFSFIQNTCNFSTQVFWDVLSVSSLLFSLTMLIFRQAPPLFTVLTTRTNCINCGNSAFPFSGFIPLLNLIFSCVYWTVHLCDSWRISDQYDVTCYFISLLMCSTCFGH